jgi:hypothetical protein
MSQYGALAMALDGSGYQEILAHYYGGLTPVEAGAHLPEQVVIGLDWGLNAVTFTATGPFEVVADGVSAGPRSGGTWSVFVDDGAVVVFPSIGYPTSPGPSPAPTPV